MSFETLVCYRCGKTPDQIEEYVDAAEAEGTTPYLYVLKEEGTLNKSNGHFACTECYIAVGMPSASGAGWKAP
jgi:hypothetical protein